MNTEIRGFALCRFLYPGKKQNYFLLADYTLLIVLAVRNRSRSNGCPVPTGWRDPSPKKRTMKLRLTTYGLLLRWMHNQDSTMESRARELTRR